MIISAVVGRDRELATLDRAIAEAAAGRQRVIVIGGPAGSGRSVLLGHARRAAASAGLPVTSARARPGGGSRVTVTLRSLAATVDQAGPTCLLLDDAHFADVPTLQALADFAASPADAPRAVVVTAADGWAPAEVMRLLAELRASPGSVVVHIGALSPQASAQLVRVRAPDATEQGCAALAVRTGGNPLWLTAVLDDLGAKGLDGGDLRAAITALPVRVRAVVAARLGFLGADAEAVARAVAVLAPRAALRHVAALAELELRVAERAADALVRTGACHAEAGGLAFAQPIVSEAISANHPPFERARWHRRSADLLAAERDGSLAQIADHLHEATPAGDGWVVEQLLAAAAAASDADDVPAAVRHLRRALGEPPPVRLGPRVLADLAIAESRISAPEATDRVEAALAECDAEARVALLREHARLAWLSNQPIEALRWSERAMAEVAPQSEAYGLTVAELLAAVSMHDLAALGRYRVLDELMRKANAGWVPETPALAGTLATVLPFTSADHRLIMPLVERALTEDLWRLDAPPYGMRPDFVICGCHFTDELSLALRLADEGVRLARRIGDAVRLGQYNYWRAMIARSMGDVPLLLEASYAALDAVADLEFSMSLPYCAGLAALGHLERNETEAAEKVLAATDDSRLPHTISNLGADEARVHVLLATGRPAEALEVARSLEQRLAAINHVDSPVVTWRPAAARAALATGDRASAGELATQETAVARRTHHRGRLGAALRVAAAVASDDDAAVELLNESVRVLRTTRCRLERARALADLGGRLAAQHRIAEAREALGEAREVAELCGATELAATTLAELRVTGARPRRSARSGLAALTDTERRIAELAAQGAGNSAIAEMLSVSPRTVEWHLRAVFHKIGISRRTELAAALAQAR